MSEVSCKYCKPGFTHAPEFKHAKIQHRGVFIERQGLDALGYKYVCHTGISYFVSGQFDTQELAIAAVDAEFDRQAALGEK